jgi:uncharacterized Zn finger protein
VPREAAFEKGRRLLIEGRVRMLMVRDEDREVSAEVRGDSAKVYAVSYDPVSGWFCSCQGYATCSHVRAVMLVVVV